MSNLEGNRMTMSKDGPDDRPLAGLRIIDLTLAMAGPLST